MTTSKRNALFVITSVLIAIALVGGAFALRGSNAAGDVRVETTSTVPLVAYSLQELATNDGKDGRDCLVAVDGKVYEIPQGVRWQNGEHLPSEGLAYCGADLSAVIGKSPHGKSKLLTLDQVGTLVR